jgi:hypothetical protein
MGNIFSGFAGPTVDPIEQAFDERKDPNNAVLIVGGGSRCADREDHTHRRHPAHAVTLSLPEGARQSMYVEPTIEGDITLADLATTLGFANTFDVVHFENVDTLVMMKAVTIANAHAMLKQGGTILIETGGVRPEHTVGVITGLLETAGFLDVSASTSNGVQIVATKNPG